MMEFGPIVSAHRVAMRVQMNQAHWTILPKRLQNRIRDRMVAANRERSHSLLAESGVVTLNVLQALFEAVPTPKRYVTHVRGTHSALRHTAEDRMIGTDALDVTNRSWPKARPAAV